MSTENFDDIVRRKFDEKQFAFNEENWEKAERKLNASRRKSKAFLWAAVFLVGLVAGAAIMFPFLGDKKEDTGSIVFTTAGNKEISITHKSGGEKEQSFSQSKTVVKNTQNTGEQLNANEKQDVVANKEERKSINPQSNMGETPGYSKSEIQRKENTASQSGNNNSTGKDDKALLAQREKNTPAKRIKNLKRETVLAKEKNSLTENKSLAENTTSKKRNSMSDGSEMDNKPAEQLVRKPDTTQSDTIASGAATHPDSAAAILAKTDSANLLKQAITDTIAKKDSIPPKTDSLAVASKDKKEEKKPSEGTTSANRIFIDAGLNYSLGWKDGNFHDGRGLTPIGGVGFTHGFNSTWALSLGVQYGSISHLSDCIKIFSDSVLYFGAGSMDTMVDTKIIYYAVFPVMLHYSLNEKNSIGAGVSVSYLINTFSDVFIANRTGIEGTSMYGMNATKLKRSSGYYKGAFSPVDIALSLSYQRKIGERLHISVLGYYGLSDIKSDAFFSTKQFERNSGLKLILSYDVFQF